MRWSDKGSESSGLSLYLTDYTIPFMSESFVWTEMPVPRFEFSPGLQIQTFLGLAKVCSSSNSILASETHNSRYRRSFWSTSR